MTDSSTPFKFLNVRPVEDSVDPDDAFAVRSHVRKAVERQKRSQQGLTVFKFVQQRTYTRKSPKVRPKQDLKPAESRKKPEVGDYRPIDKDLEAGDRVDSDATHRLNEDTTQESRFRETLTLFSPVCTHPWAIMASRHVDLPPQRLDILFKGSALRRAAEPLFDPSHVDSPRSMTAVFPSCLDDAAFFNALVSSMVIASCRGRQHTAEMLRLKCRAIQKLNESIVAGELVTKSVSLAAVLVLRGAAYKWEGSVAHAVHAEGVSKILDLGSHAPLTAATVRAIFWQDLFASILFGSPRKLSPSSLLATIPWRRLTNSSRSMLPEGFVRYNSILPIELINCIIDTQELQNAVDALPHSCSGKTDENHDRIDNMQADVESRLAVCTEKCRKAGPIPNATRIAAFIVCYSAFMDTWNCTFMPGRLAQQLLDILEDALLCPTVTARSSGDEVWQNYRDLQLWLLAVMTSTAELDAGFFPDLQPRVRMLLRAFYDWIEPHKPSSRGTPSATSSVVVVPLLLNRAMEDFINPKNCFKLCDRVDEWVTLKSFMARDSSTSPRKASAQE